MDNGQPWQWDGEFPDTDTPDNLLATGRLEVRLLTAHVAHLVPGRWNHPKLTYTHWRLYQHDRDGGSLSDPDGQTWNLTAGGVYLIPPVGPLSSRCVSPFRQLYIHFDLLGFPGLLALRDLFPGPALVPTSPACEASVAEVAEALAGDSGRNWLMDPARECWLRGVLCTALGRYLASAPPERFAQYRARVEALRPVLPALRHIHAHLAGRITNPELAAVCNLSEDYFIRRFHAATGLSPNRYILQCRVSRAAQLLLTTDESIESVASRTGFRDRFYFTRTFTRWTGRPPAAFRRGVAI